MCRDAARAGRRFRFHIYKTVLIFQLADSYDIRRKIPHYSHCATDMIRVDTVPNESISVLYKRAGQRILNLNVDGGTKVEDL